MTPEECTARLASPIQDLGAFFYFDESTISWGKENVGLDGFRFYILGRGGVLGDAPAAVVRAAFGYFRDSLIERMWTTGLERTTAGSAREVAQAYLECAYRFGAQRFGGITVDAFNSSASTVIGAVDGAGLSLFEGYRSMPSPSEPVDLACHNSILLRELRGSVHLAAVAAAGIRSDVAHAIRRPDDLRLFGLDDEPPVITDHDRHLLQQADRLTDDTMAVLLGAIDDDGRRTLVETAEAMHAAL